MRFFCDNDVDAAVAARLKKLGHEAWTASEAGLAQAKDDDLTVYATDARSALVTHDKEFSRRRKRNVVGWHIWVRCVEWEAADLLERHLDEILRMLATSDDLFIEMSNAGMHLSRQWT